MNHRERCAALLLGGLALGWGAGPVAARTADSSVITGWLDLGLPREQCLQIGTAAAREAGFAPDVPGAGSESVFAWRGSDVLSVRCLTERRLVVVFIHAAQGEAELSALLDRIGAAYSGGGGGRIRKP